jgi:ABC-type transporter Mla subunit MlaD
MLSAYQKLQANGVIGPMMKIGQDGKPVYDPGGDAPGNLVVRPFQEYPKVVKRWKDEAGNSHELIAHSKSEELKIISERIEEFSGDERSPVERERDELARGLADQQGINSQLEARLNALMAQVEQLTRVQEGPAVSPPAKSAGPQQGLGSLGQQTGPAANALSAEKKAVLNQK